jgi:hypothetical protein
MLLITIWALDIALLAFTGAASSLKRQKGRRKR